MCGYNRLYDVYLLYSYIAVWFIPVHNFEIDSAILKIIIQNTGTSSACISLTRFANKQLIFANDHGC